MADLEIKLVDAQEISKPDSLVAGHVLNADIRLVPFATQGISKRGLLLMNDGSGNFVPATSGGVSSASEIAILADDIELEENQSTEIYAYFGGEFKGSEIILAYETENDTHEDLLKAIEAKFRVQKISVS